MSYKHYEIKGGRKLSEMTEQEQAYIRGEWDRLCARKNVNTPELVFIQKPDGHFFKATRMRQSIVCGGMYRGSLGGSWSVRYGNCRRWGFKKNILGLYDPEPMDKTFSSTNITGEIVNIPSSVHTKKDVLALAAKLGFEM